MPIYEYRCDRCDQTFEVMQKFSDQPLSVHEGCGGAVERLLSSPALQFKGSGWYITDYARKNGQNGKSEAKSGANGDSAKSDSKSEAKPAPAKSETSSSSKSDSK